MTGVDCVCYWLWSNAPKHAWSKQVEAVERTVIFHGWKHFPEVLLLLWWETSHIWLRLENSSEACKKHIARKGKVRSVSFSTDIRKCTLHLWVLLNVIHGSFKVPVLARIMWDVDKTYVFTLHPLNQGGVWCSCQTKDLLQLINTCTGWLGKCHVAQHTLCRWRQDKSYRFQAEFH